jgi:tetratricopeptide (TPR) repeat protein
LAEACYRLGEYEKAIEWAQEVLRRGQPDSLLILNPLDYVWAPKVVIAGALGALGDIDKAIAVAEEALQIVPGHQELAAHVARWRQVSKREATAATFAGCAEHLIAHDEQLKALTLLEECVPYYATDHRRIVALRSMLRERIWWVAAPDSYAGHYSDGGSKPEDVVPDDQIHDLCSRLPRAQFIAQQIEDLEEAA